MQKMSFKTAVSKASENADIPFAALGNISTYHALLLKMGFALETAGVTCVMPEADGMIIFAVGYPLRPEMTECPEGMGWISPMAYGYDYHVVLKEKGNVLLKALNDIFSGEKHEIEGLVCVDTSSLIDRIAALSAEGINQTKSGFVAVPNLGTACHLGILLLRGKSDWIKKQIRESSASESVALALHPQCESCSACIKSCPGHALSEKQPLALERCISYLTQSKDLLQFEQMKTFGNRLYGCDECQISCPLNKGRTMDCNQEKENFVSLKALLEMSNKTFKSTYGHMGFAWRGASVIKRNAFIVATNQNVEFAEKIKNSQYSALVLSSKEFYNFSCKK